MPRLLPALLASAVLAFSPALAQVSTTGAGVGSPTSGGGSPSVLALDGKCDAGAASGASAACVLTTTNATDVVVCLASQAGSSGVPTIAGTATGLSSWTNRANSTANTITEFYATTTATLTGATFTFTGASGAYSTMLQCIGVSGANTSSPFDSGGPQTNGAVSSTSSIPITTTHPNDFIFGGWSLGCASCNTVGSGFTTIYINTAYQSSEYKAVTTTQTALGVSQTSSSSFNAGIADAIKGTP